MNNFTQIMFVSNMKIDNDTLHSLYTTIRFKEDKISNLKERFKVWNEGRNIYIIIEKEKIENTNTYFEFLSKNGEIIKIKKFSEKDVNFENVNIGDFVKVSGIISYAYKEKMPDGKIVDICPIDFKGNIKNKEKLAYYLTKNTGLDFEKDIEFKDRVLINRLFLEDIGLSNNDKKSKVFIKNLIMINAILPVKDEKIANLLNISSIGKKRSYGLGNLFIEII